MPLFVLTIQLQRKNEVPAAHALNLELRQLHKAKYR